MKVLHLTTHLNTGGITTYILRLIQPLKKKGIETHIASSGGDYVSQMHERGALTLELPIKTKSELNPLIYTSIPKLLRYIKRHRIDVLHAHTRVTQVLSAWIKRLTGIPVVTTCHGFYKRRLGRILNPSWGDKCIAISDGVAEHLSKDHKVPLSKRQVVCNAVDFDEIDMLFSQKSPESSKKGYGFGEKDPVIGIVSRLVGDKGHDYLLRAVSSLKQHYSNIRLLIVGDGRYRRPLQQLSDELGLKGNVYFTGNIMDVTQALAAMDIFVLPAVWREGFGLSLVEAMACYKPVIASNIWSLNRLISNRVNGILIEPKSVEALVTAIDELLKNSDLRTKVVQTAREQAESLFCISRMTDEISGIYSSVVAKG